MSSGNTPKKLSKKGPIPRSICYRDFCRICKCSFRIENGNLAAKSSFENLFKPSERKESKGLILADACAAIGLKVIDTPGISERVCRPCGRKIRTAAENVSFLKDKLYLDETAALKPNSPNTNEPPCSVQVVSPVREKRQLSTTITPNRRLKDKQFKRETENSRTALFKEKENQDDPTNCNLSVDDEIRSLYNIDTFETTVKESKIRVIISHTGGSIIVKETFDNETTRLLRAILY